MPSGTCCLRRDTGVLYHHTFTLSSLFLVNFSTFILLLFITFLHISFQYLWATKPDPHLFPCSHLALGIHQPSARESWITLQLSRASSLQSPTKKSVACKGSALLHLHLYNYTSFNGLILTPIPIVGAIVTLLRN